MQITAIIIQIIEVNQLTHSSNCDGRLSSNNDAIICFKDGLVH